MSVYAPLIRAARLRSMLLQSQAESIADEDMTAARVLRGLALVEESVAKGLEHQQEQLEEPVRRKGPPPPKLPKKR